MRRKIAAGNWKMNGLVTSLAELDAIIGGAGQPNCDVLICPPATLIAGFAGIARTSIVRIGGQNCHSAVSGAHTGEISAEMIKDAGGVAVIVGHSERRQDNGETDADVRRQQVAAEEERIGLVSLRGQILKSARNLLASIFVTPRTGEQRDAQPPSRRLTRL